MSSPARVFDSELVLHRSVAPDWPWMQPQRVFLRLGTCIVLLLGCYAATVAVRLTTGHERLHGLVRLFDLDGEANIPTFFSVFQFNVAAGLLWIIGSRARCCADRYARHWLALACIFVFLGLDELAQIHELFSDPLRASLHVDGALRYAWVIPYGCLVLAVAAAYLNFLSHLPDRTRWLMVISAAIYVGGAVGLELYGGYLETQLGTEATGTSVAYLIEVFFEEGMELLGIALFIFALLEYIGTSMGWVQINVGSGPTAEPIQELTAMQTLHLLVKRWL